MSRVTEYEFHLAGHHAVTGVVEMLGCSSRDTAERTVTLQEWRP